LTNDPQIKNNYLIKLSGNNYFWLTLILIITFLVYLPAFENGFTNWDDDKYVTENPLITEFSANNIRLIFSDFYLGNYHPLTLISLAADYQIDNLNPFYFHLTNILLHFINIVLVFYLVLLLIKNLKIAIITSILFAVHSLQVESVVWISERKDVLYTMFFLASLISYIIYIKNPRYKFYILSLFLFILSLLSKGMAVSLTIVIVFIDYLYRRKFSSKKVIIEKIPFLILSLIFGILAVSGQNSTGYIADNMDYGLVGRLLIVCSNITRYIFHLIAPLKLSAFYPYPSSELIPFFYWFYFLPVLGVIFYFIYFIKRSRLIVFGLAFFLVTIFFVLQLIPVGSAVIADRYTYLPSIGFFILLGSGIEYLSSKKFPFRSKIFMKILSPGNFTIALLFVYILFLGINTNNRCRVWKDSISLWNDVLKKYPASFIALNNRGLAKSDKGDLNGALKDLSLSVETNPKYSKSFFNRGIIKDDLKDFEGAVVDFDRAIQLQPDFAEAYFNRGIVKENLGDYDGAINDYSLAIDIKPEYSEAYYNTGLLMDNEGDLQTAIKYYSFAIQYNPNFPEAYYNLAVVSGKSGDQTAAIYNYQQAIRLKPDYPEAYYNMGNIKFSSKNLTDALKDYNKAIEQKPDFVNALLNRGILKASMNNYSGAIEDFNLVISLDAENALVYYNRGMAKIESGFLQEGCSDLNKAYEKGLEEAYQKIINYCNN